MTTTIRDELQEVVDHLFVDNPPTNPAPTTIDIAQLKKGRVRPRTANDARTLVYLDVIASPELAPYIAGGSVTGTPHEPRIRFSVEGGEAGAHDAPLQVARELHGILANNPPPGWTWLIAIDGTPILEPNETPTERPVYRFDLRGRYEEA